MKNIFYLLLTTLLFVFVANSPTFGMESDYDPVKVENVIYCDCLVYEQVAPILETSNEFAEPLLPKMQIENSLQCSYFIDGYKCRDNIEGEKQFYTTTNENIQNYMIVATATVAKRDRKYKNRFYFNTKSKNDFSKVISNSLNWH